MRRGIFKAGRLAVSLLFVLFFASALRAEQIPAGEIVQKVICQSDASQNYALYLPSNYTPGKKWPILYAFDPAARGSVPVERFKAAAEKYGYIVLGSNNSRNGSWEAPAAAIKAMWSDTHARFPIDEKRIYLTGFSGGVRVAITIAQMLKDKVAGIIACSGGFPPEIEPSKSTSFALFITTGFEDFYYEELNRLDRQLDLLGVANRLEWFEGGHEWAPVELCAAAIEWMEIQAMKTGSRAKDDALVGQILEKNIARAREYEASGKLYQAYTSYSRIAEDFKALRDVTALASTAAKMRESKQVKQAIEDQMQQEEQQQQRSAQLHALRAKITNLKEPAATGGFDRTAQTGGFQDGPQSNAADARRLAILQLRGAVADLKKDAARKDASADRAVARRVLNQFSAFLYETAMILIQNEKYEQAIASLSLDSETFPDNWRALYHLAYAYSLKGDKKKSLEALKKAVQKGFADLAELESNSAFDSLCEEAAYKKIVESLTKK